MNHLKWMTLCIISFLFSANNLYSQQAANSSHKPHVLLVMGSVRVGRTAEKIAKAIIANADLEKIDLEIIDLQELNLPIVHDDEPLIKNNATSLWSQKVASADAIIFLIPNYNEGYSGVVKNAIDSVTPSWKNKVVGLITYAGGYECSKPAHHILPVLSSVQAQVLTEHTVCITFSNNAVIDSKKFKKEAHNTAINNLLEAIITTARA